MKIIRKKLLILSFIVLFLLFFVFLKLPPQIASEEKIGIENPVKKKFSPQTVSPGNTSEYDINLKMDTDGKFRLKTSVEIINISEDPWEQLVFYFIPNMYTKSVSPDLEHPSTVDFHNISINGEQAIFTLEKDTLNIKLSDKLELNQEIRVDFSYDLTLPEEGFRFTKSNENFHLAQFYPMLATYRNHQWNKEEYRDRGETYHTTFSNFKLTYEIPEEYNLVSSFDHEVFPSPNKGSFEVKNVKEVFLAILKNPTLMEKEGDIAIRVFGLKEENQELYKEIGDEASTAIKYFEDIMGPYPFKQLDVVIDGIAMEYPGIVTAHTIRGGSSIHPNALKDIVIHEIAHQYFYGIISNDPYRDAWLDEGFTSFATSLYHFSKTKESVPYESMYKQIEHLEHPVNLPLDQYESNVSSYVYGKSSTMLWRLFEKDGGREEAEKFLKNYYQFYKYKEVNTKEFVRFAQYYFNLEDISEFETWLELND